MCERLLELIILYTFLCLVSRKRWAPDLGRVQNNTLLLKLRSQFSIRNILQSQALLERNMARVPAGLAHSVELMLQPHGT